MASESPPDLPGAHEHVSPHAHPEDGDHDHGHRHGGHAGGGSSPRHAHGHASTSAAAQPEALRVVVIGSLGLFAVAAIELVTAALTSSAAVLADGLHNAGDVFTTVALAAAFILSRRAPTRRFPYGYHRSEDLAGLVVLLLIVVSAVASGVTSVEHLLHRQPVDHPAIATAVALIGFVGNEAVARYKISAGRALDSVALVADGEHSRIDGIASIGAAAGVVGSWAGAPVLDPVAGVVITAIIAAVAWETGRNVTGRLLDEADSSLLETIEEVAAAVPGVVTVEEARARWTGRRVLAELTLAVPGTETVARAHALAEEVRHALFHRVDALADVVVHLNPAGDTAAHDATSHHDEVAPRPRPPAGPAA